jgi:Peptidase family M1 domain
MDDMVRMIDRVAARVLVVLALMVIAVPGRAVVAQDAQSRPIPAATVPPAEYQRAVDRSWRSEDGSPGPGYWQQWAGYDIRAKLDPESAKLEGTVRILYFHDAPANLASVMVHLHQNIHQEGAPRLEQTEVTGGVTIKRLAADGEELTEHPLSEGPGYEIDGTIMEVRPSIRLERGDTLQLDIDWEVTLPQHGVGRMGYSDKEVYFVGYWFPKMGVFDNLRGWSAEPYLGNGEFYDEFGDYEVELTVPTDWTVMATGDLENPEDVFSVITRERLAAAAVADTLVVIADQASRDAGTVTTEGIDGWLTYRFTADNVRDFAWTASNVQQWDATSALVGPRVDLVTEEDHDDAAEGGEHSDDEGDDESGSSADEGANGGGSGAADDEESGSSSDRPASGPDRRVLIHSFWRENRAPLWSQQWEYGKQSIEFHSEFTGFPYPWSHMTSVEGADIIDGGMEFPMLTVIGPYEGEEPSTLFNTTSHEIGHMWIPMIVGTDEKRYAWMDEGSTTFLEQESRMALWPGVDHHRVEARTYLQVAAAGLEQSMMRQADYYEPGPGYGVASYSKPATLMTSLRAVIGEEAWDAAYQAFISEWAYKHPAPWDFFDTFERFAEQDLDWFWTSFYYNTWTLDHAVGRVQPKPAGGALVTIEDRGLAIFPATVRIRTTNGMDFVHNIPVEHWMAGNKTYEIDIAPTAGAVTRVEIDAAGISPDTDRTNNFWPQGR